MKMRNVFATSLNKINVNLNKILKNVLSNKILFNQFQLNITLIQTNNLPHKFKEQTHESFFLEYYYIDHAACFSLNQQRLLHDKGMNKKQK